MPIRYLTPLPTSIGTAPKSGAEFSTGKQLAQPVGAMPARAKYSFFDHLRA